MRVHLGKTAAQGRRVRPGPQPRKLSDILAAVAGELNWNGDCSLLLVSLPTISGMYFGGYLTQVKHVWQCIGVCIRKYEKHCKAWFDFMQCKHTFLWLFLKSWYSNSSHKLEFIFFMLHVINLFVKEEEEKRFLSTLIIIQNLSSIRQMNYHQLYL